MAYTPSIFDPYYQKVVQDLIDLGVARPDVPVRQLAQFDPFPDRKFGLYGRVGQPPQPKTDDNIFERGAAWVDQNVVQNVEDFAVEQAGNLWGWVKDSAVGQFVDNNIIDPAVDAVQATNNAVIQPVIDAVVEPAWDAVQPYVQPVVETAWDRIEPFAQPVIDQTVDAANWVWDEAKQTVREPLGQYVDATGWAIGKLSYLQEQNTGQMGDIWYEQSQGREGLGSQLYEMLPWYRRTEWDKSTYKDWRSGGLLAPWIDTPPEQWAKDPLNNDRIKFAHEQGIQYKLGTDGKMEMYIIGKDGPVLANQPVLKGGDAVYALYNFDRDPNLAQSILQGTVEDPLFWATLLAAGAGVWLRGFIGATEAAQGVTRGTQAARIALRTIEAANAAQDVPFKPLTWTGGKFLTKTPGVRDVVAKTGAYLSELSDSAKHTVAQEEAAGFATARDNVAAAESRRAGGPDDIPTGTNVGDATIPEQDFADHIDPMRRADTPTVDPSPATRDLNPTPASAAPDLTPAMADDLLTALRTGLPTRDLQNGTGQMVRERAGVDGWINRMVADNPESWSRMAPQLRDAVEELRQQLARTTDKVERQFLLAKWRTVVADVAQREGVDLKRYARNGHDGFFPDLQVNRRGTRGNKADTFSREGLTEVLLHADQPAAGQFDRRSVFSRAWDVMTARQELRDVALTPEMAQNLLTRVRNGTLVSEVLGKRINGAVFGGGGLPTEKIAGSPYWSQFLAQFDKASQRELTAMAKDVIRQVPHLSGTAPAHIGVQISNYNLKKIADMTFKQANGTVVSGSDMLDEIGKVMVQQQEDAYAYFQRIQLARKEWQTVLDQPAAAAPDASAAAPAAAPEPPPAANPDALRPEDVDGTGTPITRTPTSVGGRATNEVLRPEELGGIDGTGPLRSDDLGGTGRPGARTPASMGGRGNADAVGPETFDATGTAASAVSNASIAAPKPPISIATKSTAFQQLADLQRGAPEDASMAISRSGIYGPNQYNVAKTYEWAGDLLHRMTNMGGGTGDDVVKLRDLWNWMGDIDAFKQLDASAGVLDPAPFIRYADEYAKLPVYNEVQYHARQLAVELGKRNFDVAHIHLTWLHDTLNQVGPAEWNRLTGKFDLNYRPAIDDLLDTLFEATDPIFSATSRASSAPSPSALSVLPGNAATPPIAAASPDPVTPPTGAATASAPSGTPPVRVGTLDINKLGKPAPAYNNGGRKTGIIASFEYADPVDQALSALTSPDFQKAWPALQRLPRTAWVKGAVVNGVKIKSAWIEAARYLDLNGIPDADWADAALRLRTARKDAAMAIVNNLPPGTHGGVRTVRVEPVYETGPKRPSRPPVAAAAPEPGPSGTAPEPTLTDDAASAAATPPDTAAWTPANLEHARDTGFLPDATYDVVSQQVTTDIALDMLAKTDRIFLKNGKRLSKKKIAAMLVEDGGDQRTIYDLYDHLIDLTDDPEFAESVVVETLLGPKAYEKGLARAARKKAARDSGNLLRRLDRDTYTAALNWLRSRLMYNVVTGPSAIGMDAVGDTLIMAQRGELAAAGNGLMGWRHLTKAFSDQATIADVADVSMWTAAGVRPPDYLSHGIDRAVSGQPLAARTYLRDERVWKWFAGAFENESLKKIRHFGDAIRRYALETDSFLRELATSRTTLIGEVRERALKNGLDANAIARQFDQDLPRVFSPDDVERLAKSVFADPGEVTALRRSWANKVNTATRTAKQAQEKVLFSYRMTRADQMLSKFFFFHYWQTRAFALYAETALKNPALLNVYIRAWEAIKFEAEREGYPPEFQGYVRFMADQNGLAGYLDPLGVLTPFAVFQNLAEENGNGPAWKKAVGDFFFVNSIVGGALAVIGLQEIKGIELTNGTPDWTASRAVSNAATNTLNWINAQFDLGLNDGKPIPNLEEKIMRMLVDGGNAKVRELLPTQDWEAFDPASSDMAKMQSILYDQYETKYGPADTWNTKTSDAYAASVTVLHNGGKDAEADKARDTFWDQRMKFQVLREFIGGTRIRSMPLDANKQLTRSTNDAVSGPAYDVRGLMTGSTDAVNFQVQRDQYNAIGTDRQRELADRFNAIRNGEFVGIIEINGIPYVPEQLQQLTEKERTSLAYLWLGTQGGTKELKDYWTQRDTFRTDHPLFTQWGEYWASKDAFPTESAWRAELAKRNPAYAEALRREETYLRDLRLAGAALTPKQIEQRLSSWSGNDGYLAWLGATDSVYAEPLPATGGGGGLPKPEETKEETPSETETAFTAQLDRLQSAKYELKDQIANAKQSLEARGLDVPGDWDAVMRDPELANEYRRLLGVDFPEPPLLLRHYWAWQERELTAGRPGTMEEYAAFLTRDEPLPTS